MTDHYHDLHVCRVPEIARWRRIFNCPTCARRTRHVVKDFAWYGLDVVCCGCGVHFTDDHVFRESATTRRKNVERARAEWNLEPFDRRAEYWADYLPQRDDR